MLAVGLLAGGYACRNSGSSSGPTATTVPESGASFILTVTNQSFENPTVDMEVFIDDKRYVAGAFQVDGQHRWYGFALSIPPGDHRVVARSEHGERHEEMIELPEEGVRYGVLSYWGQSQSGGGQPFTLAFQAEPPVFG